MTAPAPLTLIVEGKPLVFDNPVPVGEVIPAGTWVRYDTGSAQGFEVVDYSRGPIKGVELFTARPPVAPESFADGDVAWLPYTRTARPEMADRWQWVDPDGEDCLDDKFVARWIAQGDGYLVQPSRPESLADVLDDLGLTDEQRARVEKAVER